MAVGQLASDTGESMDVALGKAKDVFVDAKAAKLGDAVALHKTSYLHVESTVLKHLGSKPAGNVESTDVIRGEKLVMAALTYVLHRMAPGCSAHPGLRSQAYYDFMQDVTSNLKWGVGSVSWRFVVYMDTHVYFSTSDSIIIPIPKADILDALTSYMMPAPETPTPEPEQPPENAVTKTETPAPPADAPPAEAPPPTPAGPAGPAGPAMTGGKYEIINEKYEKVLGIVNKQPKPPTTGAPAPPGVNVKFAAVFFLLHRCCLKGAMNETNEAFFASMQPTYKAFSNNEVPHRIAVNEDNYVYAAGGGEKFIEKDALRKHHIFSPEDMISAATIWLEASPQSAPVGPPAVPPAVTPAVASTPAAAPAAPAPVDK